MKEAEKTVLRPFIDVFFLGELDSGVEIGVRNPAHSQIWAFLGTTFSPDIGSIVKNFCAANKIRPARHIL